MPQYEIHHHISLSPSQQDAIAGAITRIHTQLFTTASSFVNVSFTDISAKPTYIGGKRRHSNFINATVRHGPARTREDYRQLCLQISREWEKIVVQGGKTGPNNDGAHGEATNGGKGLEDTGLRAVFILGSLVTAWEAGLIIPEAGKDKEWWAENLPELRCRAGEGDEEMSETLEELKGRKEFAGIFETEND